MGEFYTEAKALLLDRRESVFALATSLLRFDAIEFYRRSYLGGAQKYSTSAALGLIFIITVFLLSWVNPLDTHSDEMRLLKESVVVFLVSIISVVPGYCILRLRRKRPIFLFLINIALMAGTCGAVLTQTGNYTAILLNGQLYSDLELIKDGHGKNTPLYVGVCQPLLDQRDALIDQLEINKLTGEYDIEINKTPVMHIDTYDEAVRKFILTYPQVHAREIRLSQQDRVRLGELRVDLQLKLRGAVAGSNIFISSYPAFAASSILSFIINSSLIIISWVFIGRFYFSDAANARSRIEISLQLGTAMIVSTIFTVIVGLSINDLRPHLRYGLKESGDLLRGQYESVGWACGGHFDSKNLW